MASGDSVAQVTRLLPIETQLNQPSTSSAYNNHTASNTPSTCPFLRLPRELRDIIYTYYTAEPDGVVYDPRKEKLTKANGDRIELAFVCTCRLVAKELGGLSLSLNKITFHTSFSDDFCERAGMFHAAIAQFGLQKAFLLKKLAPRLLTEELEKNISLRFSQFSPIL
jgi:hypothetical protein